MFNFFLKADVLIINFLTAKEGRLCFSNVYMYMYVFIFLRNALEPTQLDVFCESGINRLVLVVREKLGTSKFEKKLFTNYIGCGIKLICFTKKTEFNKDHKY